MFNKLPLKKTLRGQNNLEESTKYFIFACSSKLRFDLSVKLNFDLKKFTNVT